MAKRVVDESSLTSVANAIRSKKGTTAPLVFPEGFNSAIATIETDPKLQSKEVIPSSRNQTVFPDTDYDGLSHVTVTGDPDLVSGNIKEGVNIFGVIGTHTGIGGSVTDTSDATATEDDIEKGKTAYVNGKKITGKHECEECLDTSDATATENDLLKGATAYVNGEKITGMHECDVFTLPTLTTPGTANDLASGKQLIDATGNVVTGNVPVVTMLTATQDDAFVSFNAQDNRISMSDNFGKRQIVEGNASVIVSAPASEFGDASAGDVAKGKTFTSQNGLKVVGTHECEAGVELPTLTTPGTADDLAKGKQLIDANGNVVTGTLYEYTADSIPIISNHLSSEVFTTEIQGVPTLNIKGSYAGTGVVRRQAMVQGRAPLSMLGDATAADVVAGKTFTSAAGLDVVGTMAPGGGFTVTDDGAGNVTITSSAITDNDGNVVIA